MSHTDDTDYELYEYYARQLEYWMKQMMTFYICTPDHPVICVKKMIPLDLVTISVHKLSSHTSTSDSAYENNSTSTCPAVLHVSNNEVVLQSVKRKKTNESQRNISV